MREIPPLVISRATAAGEAGIEWLAKLDNIISEMEKQWEIAIGQSLFGGSTAFVANASDKQGKRYVLKLEMPDSLGQVDFSMTIKALELVGGNGYVTLFAYDNEKKAALLERLGKPLKETSISISEQITIICSTLQKTWSIPIPYHHAELHNGKEVLSWFSGFIETTWKSVGQPCSKKTIEQAYRFLQSRQANENPENHVLIHGDAHNANILQDLSSDNQFKLIDPDGTFYEKAYDLGVLMREWREEYQHHPLTTGIKRCEKLSLLTGVDQQAIWEWGFLQCVSTGLLLMSFDHKSGRDLLNVAEAWTNRR
ncbi:phosphotransferase [Virgibacillus sp. NKC19-3]|uniref:aminoglycoside phosphotransferase family protein n=1 Tax=Virgibacillus saliphilus TaxID=2831674 RepID=UPI001C9B0C4B|nr:aminoglycoside phosphotransferase family protein [Virgibacillus sp. NKC19-3]MBY7142569.1 phosphotransferase [Virgibacillus sp. NKC19-3]